LKDVQEAEDEAEELKQECFVKGLVDEDGEPTDFQTRESVNFVNEVDAGSEMSEYLKFPLLLPQPEVKDLGFYESAPKPNEVSNSAGDHINQWLLHQLRTSPLDVNLLASVYTEEGGETSDEWEVHVLDLWYKDGAIKGASGYRVYSVSDAFASESTDTVSHREPPVSGQPTHATESRNEPLVSGQSTHGTISHHEPLKTTRSRSEPDLQSSVKEVLIAKTW